MSFRSISIPYLDGTQQLVDTIENLKIASDIIQTPIILQSLTADGVIQQSKSIQYQQVFRNAETILRFDNGSLVNCTVDQEWVPFAPSNRPDDFQVVNKSAISLADITKIPYIKTSSLSVGDKIKAMNRDGYVTISTIDGGIGYQPYIHFAVPVFGNFLVSLTGQDGLATLVVARSTNIIQN